MTTPPRVELVAAALRRDLSDLDLYAHFLQATLEESLPPGMLEVTRDPSLSDRLRGRPGPVASLAVTVEDRRYVLHPHRGAPRAEVVHVVRGLELDHDDLPLDAWITRLAEALSRHAESNARAAEALARITDPSGAL
ncbi:MAG: hypothetical protein ACXVGH_02290 [Mycobacteriales bacterium]